MHRSSANERGWQLTAPRVRRPCLCGACAVLVWCMCIACVFARVRGKVGYHTTAPIRGGGEGGDSSQMPGHDPALPRDETVEPSDTTVRGVSGQ